MYFTNLSQIVEWTIINRTHYIRRFLTARELFALTCFFLLHLVFVLVIFCGCGLVQQATF